MKRLPEDNAQKVIVVGGGPAGMMAAGMAAKEGAKVLLLEKNPRIGRKLLLTGKGRCNITNMAPLPEFVENFPGNGAFLYGPLNAFSNQDLIDFLADQGLATKVERGGRVFPVSDRSADVLRALERFIRTAGVRVLTNQPVIGLLIEKKDTLSSQVLGVVTESSEYRGGAVILATGGLSYPATGSTGDGYRWAVAAGHTVISPWPGLVPLEVEEKWVKDVQGLSLKNIRVTARVNQPGAQGSSRVLGEEFGEMLFTHFGVSGPIILSLSSSIAQCLFKKKNDDTRAEARITLSINLKPALIPEQLDRRLQRDLAANSRKLFKNSLGNLLPKAMIPVIIGLSGIPEDKFTHQITREERMKLASLLTDLRLTVTGTRPIEEAIVTAGGVSTREVDPRTMASRLADGLYFAGEMLDVDGYTGGFNLQAAFSTGYVAGRAAGKKVQQST
ncbi:MAG: NAD(P)/FAD-dependent oxidoreductase [Bacillota bacterium]